MTLGLILFAICVVLAGSALSEWIYRESIVGDEPPGAWQRLAAAAVTSLLLLIAIDWTLSWFSLLDRVPLFVAGAICGVAGLAWHIRRETFTKPLSAPDAAAQWALLLPLLIWIVFVLWRGFILPVANHDALAYHLPKALMLARAHRFEFISAPDPRIGTSPANYEMLLADVLLLTGSDAATEWVGTATYILFILLAGALFERWWGKGIHVTASVLLTAAIPVVLLHAGAHKNDVMVNALYLAALFWGAQWAVSGTGRDACYTFFCLAAAGGTKLNAALVGISIAAVALVRILRRKLVVRRTVVVAGVASVIAFIAVLGGYVFIANLRYADHIAMPSDPSVQVGYGDWTNLIEFPLMLLIRPFEASNAEIHVPWRSNGWYWPRFEIYFSDFGPLVSCLALMLPFVVRLYQRRWGTDEIRDERRTGSWMAAGAFFLMLPIRMRPFGFFTAYARYVAFAAVYVIAWTAVPLIRQAMETAPVPTRRRLLAGLVVIFVLTAGLYTVFDAFEPLAYITFQIRNPSSRVPWFDPFRAGVVADRMAGPADTIAVDAGFDTWVYPLYGADLQRKVVYVNATSPIPSEAKWVVVDRSWHVAWGHPDFHNTGQWHTYLGHGISTPDDVAVINRLRADPRHFQLIYWQRTRNQAIFRRIGS